MERFFTELPPQLSALQLFSEAHPEILCRKVQTEPPPHQEMATLTTEAHLVKVILLGGMRLTAKQQDPLLNYTVVGRGFCLFWCGVVFFVLFYVVLCRCYFGGFLFCFFVAVVFSRLLFGVFRVFVCLFKKPHTLRTQHNSRSTNYRKMSGCWGRGILLGQKSFMLSPRASEKELCLKITEKMILLLAWEWRLNKSLRYAHEMLSRRGRTIQDLTLAKTK